MNTLQLETGGRPVANDDFQTLQDIHQVLSLPALLASVGPCVVSGCRVYQTGSQYNVGAGVVWDGANLLDFTGRSNVSLPAMFAPGAVVVVDERAYQTGGTKTAIKGQTMDLVPLLAGAPNLVVNTYGALTLWHRIQEKTRGKFEIQTLGSAAYVSANYDHDGLGLPGTEAWGWALANGLHNTDDLQGRTVAGLDPANADYALGAAGGQNSITLTTANLPANPPNTPVFLAYTGNPNGMNIVPSGNNGWEGRQTPAGNGTPIDTRMPYRALLVRQWVGF
ncbi:hypothetical protein GKZ68_10500 [Hymenobacter sp. BRD128]|uniref:hypothetical protein n=1 Tax=Hymenobacter sp. BRD128 TaxID=2675878 RepID=UPI0015633328|nr:hypothetical protein [Hymenobacter sp. BRD128]QKG57019.1 hypothetical protein GKZ68_10500 [Hymenobacter sp. BRD128]